MISSCLTDTPNMGSVTVEHAPGEICSIPERINKGGKGEACYAALSILRARWKFTKLRLMCGGTLGTHKGNLIVLYLLLHNPSSSPLFPFFPLPPFSSVFLLFLPLLWLYFHPNSSPSFLFFLPDYTFSPPPPKKLQVLK